MTHLVKLSLSGFDSFASSRTWIDSVTGSLFCPHCHNVYPTVEQVDAVVQSTRRNTDIDNIAVNCHRVHVLSTHFINLVGIGLMSSTANIGLVSDEAGREYDRYRTAVAKDDAVVVRGPKGSSIGLCRECGRILYWPIGEKYVLRSQLPNEPFFLSNGQIFCTPDFYESRIKNARLKRVQAESILIRDEPIDDLPSSARDLQEALRLQKRLK